MYIHNYPNFYFVFVASDYNEVNSAGRTCILYVHNAHDSYDIKDDKLLYDVKLKFKISL